MSLADSKVSRQQFTMQLINQ